VPAAAGRKEAWLSWIFIHGTDKEEGSLMVLFFDLVFSITPMEITMQI